MTLQQNHRISDRWRYLAVFICLIVAFIILMVWNINSGAVDISFTEIMKIIFTKTGNPTNVNIIWEIRLPRIISAAILGGGLAVSGFLMQTFFSNPIAGPYVLGISSGSKLFVAVAMILALKYVHHTNSWMIVMAAFIGALIAMGFVLLAARAIKQMSMLLVAGIMISYICSAITEFLITFAQDSDIVNLHNWSQGSFSGVSWSDVGLSSKIVLVCFVIVFAMSKPIGAYQMGESYAQSMGVNVKRFRVYLIMMSSLLGLKTAKPILVIPCSFMAGSVFCMFCDYIARTAFAPVELSISTVTAMFGAPIVIGMLVKRHGTRY